MRKILFLSAVLSVFVLTSCGNETKEEVKPTTDSTCVAKCDTTKCDTTCAKVDTTKK